MAEHVPTEYRELPGLLGYRVGSDGTVWSRRKRGGNSAGHFYDFWRQLKPGRDRDGYLQVNVGGLMRKVHRLVLEAFVGPRIGRLECRHLNGIKDDNRLPNLAWGSTAENGADKVSHSSQARGETCGKSKLNDSVVLEIRRRVAAGESQTNVAMSAGTTLSNVSSIVHRKTWKHL